MPTALPFRASLEMPATADATTIQLAGDTTTLCADIAAPAHAFMTIYTIGGTEQVLVHGCDGARLRVTRGVNGTTARAWPVGACVKIAEIEPGAVCPDTTTEDDACACEPFDPVASIALGKGLTWDLTQPENPKLRLEPTGVVPANMSCGTIDDCGRLVSIPENWPQVCITPFDNCCDSGSGVGGAVDACDVMFSPAGGVITATDVCGALQQLSDAVAAGSGGGSGGVSSVVAGTGINVAGTVSVPVVSLTATGITAGTYDGFTVDTEGRITAYVAPPVTVLPIVGVAPITATYAAGTGTYTITCAVASTDDFGVVRLADPGNVSTPVLIADDDVVTYEFLEAYLTDKGLI